MTRIAKTQLVHAVDAEAGDCPHAVITDESTGEEVVIQAESIGRAIEALQDIQTPRPPWIGIEVSTGKWVGGVQTLYPNDGPKIASSVLPGWPPELIAEAYGAWLSDDPVQP
jgi:hypothetical protein